MAGVSSSLPEEVQQKMYRTILGCENVEIMRNAYAIEYDCVDPTSLYPTLEFKDFGGLYGAGQFNGSSGYEEAAVQGFVAGVNAALKILGREPMILDRSVGYIGTLIDDLVTKGTNEPYRMMTSRSEYRLLHRQDNADIRLRKIGHDIGLVSDDDYEKTLEKYRLVDAEIKRLQKTHIAPTDELAEMMRARGTVPPNSGISLAALICRPQLDYECIAPFDKNRPALPREVWREAQISLKYSGYIEKQLKQVEDFKKLESKKLPKDINYDEIPVLRLEARQKLGAMRPDNMGQASRISGISPADIAALMVYLSK